MTAVAELIRQTCMLFYKEGLDPPTKIVLPAKAWRRFAIEVSEYCIIHDLALEIRDGFSSVRLSTIKGDYIVVEREGA